MIIGVPKEIKNSENRVGLVPAGVKALRAKGHTILVERNAGAGIGVSDQEFERAGATIVPTNRDVWGKAEMIIKVKEPLPPEYELMRPNQILYTYLHLAAEPELTKELVKKGVVGVAYETIQMADGSLPLLTPMSEVAGRMATQVGAYYLQKDHGGKGILLGGVPGVAKGHVTVIGGGIAGTNAIAMALGLGAKVSVLDVNVRRLEHLEHIFGGGLQTLYSNAENIEKCVVKSDLVIGAVLVTGAKAPVLVTRQMISAMEPGSVIVDIAVDQGGCIETCHATSHTEPTFVVDGVIHYCVPNMPGAVARTSTYALTNVTLSYALELANKGVKRACQENPPLRMGVNCFEGSVCYEPVARSLNLNYKELSF